MCLWRGLIFDSILQSPSGTAAGRLFSICRLIVLLLNNAKNCQSVNEDSTAVAYDISVGNVRVDLRVHLK
jgi:hypothetical protein